MSGQAAWMDQMISSARVCRTLPTRHSPISSLPPAPRRCRSCSCIVAPPNLLVMRSDAPKGHTPQSARRLGASHSEATSITRQARRASCMHTLPVSPMPEVMAAHMHESGSSCGFWYRPVHMHVCLALWTKAMRMHPWSQELPHACTHACMHGHGGAGTHNDRPGDDRGGGRHQTV